MIFAYGPLNTILKISLTIAASFVIFVLKNTITDYIYIDIDTVKPNTTIELGKTRTNELALNAIKMKTTELAFNVITTYSNMKINVSRIIYNNNGLKTAVDYGYYIMLLLKSYFLGYPIEPTSDYWICINTIMDSQLVDIYEDDSTISILIHIMDTYHYGNNLDTPPVEYNLLEDYKILDCKPTNDTFIGMISKTNIKKERLLTCKYDKQYMYRVYNISNESTTIDNNIPLIKCPIQFISIQYCNNINNNKVDILLDKNIYIEGNEILSATFIHRYLTYHNKSYLFDYDYTLTFIDTNINQFTLNNEQYIKLNDASYEIMDINKLIPVYEDGDNGDSDSDSDNGDNGDNDSGSIEHISLDSDNDALIDDEHAPKHDNFLWFLYNQFSV